MAAALHSSATLRAGLQDETLVEQLLLMRLDGGRGSGQRTESIRRTRSAGSPHVQLELIGRLDHLQAHRLLTANEQPRDFGRS